MRSWGFIPLSFSMETYILSDILTSNPIVTETVVSGEEIAPIVYDLEMAAEGYPRDHLAIALISMAIVVIHPNVNPERLPEYVKDTSHFLCMLTSDDELDMGPRNMKNLN